MVKNVIFLYNHAYTLSLLCNEICKKHERCIIATVGIGKINLQCVLLFTFLQFGLRFMAPGLRVPELSLRLRIVFNQKSFI